MSKKTSAFKFRRGENCKIVVPHAVESYAWSRPTESAIRQALCQRNVK